MAQEYPNSGAMFTREKRSQNSADMSGDFTISGDVLDYILREYENGNRSVSLEIAGWKRRSSNGGQFMSVKIQTPYSERGGGQKRGNAPSRGPSRYEERTSPSRPYREERRPAADDDDRFNRGNRGRQKSFDEDMNDDLPDFDKPSREKRRWE